METVEKELHELYRKYRNFDFIGKHDEISKTITNNKYSKGVGHYAGLYEPSYVLEMQISNWTIGKEVKKPDKGFDYKYYFDEREQILLSEKYLSGRLSYVNYYFYLDDTCEFVHYDYAKKRINRISKSFYDKSGRIIRHIELQDIFKEEYQIAVQEEQLFRYENDVVYIKTTTHRPYCEIYSIEFPARTTVTNMMIKENVLYFLNEDNSISGYFNIRFKLIDGKKVEVPLPKRVPIFKIIKENIIKILDKWKSIDKSVIWINCESSDLEMQYTSQKEDSEEKWNIAFYDANEEQIFEDKNHIQVLEDLLFNSDCNLDDLINESDYFIEKMIKIIKELRKEGYISDSTAVILSNLEISKNTLDIAKKINKKETIKGFYKEFDI